MPTPRTLPLIALCVLPTCSYAQGWGWRPALMAWERADDNLFSRPEARESDWITGVEPGVAVARTGPRWSLEARYSQAAERYASHVQLDTLDARREGSLRWEAQAAHALDASLTAAYLRSASAGELYRTSGIDFGRVPAQRLQLAPALAWRLSAVTSLGADVSATRDEIEGSGALDSTVVGMRFDRRTSGRAQLSVRGQARWYELSAGMNQASQLLAVGYRRELGRSLELAFDAGPQLARGALSAEWLGSLRAHGRRSEWAVEWSQSEAAVVGAPKPVVTRRLGAYASRSAGRLGGRLAFDLLQNHGGLEGRTLQASAEGHLRLWEPLAVTLASAWSRQQGDSPAADSGEVRHLVTELRLVLKPRPRVEHAHVR